MVRSKTRSQVWLVLAGLTVLLLVVAGCSRPTSRPQQSPAPPSPVEGSVRVGALTLTAQLPLAELLASSTQTVTVLVANESETATEIVTPVIRLRIIDSAGKTVFDTMPKPMSIPFPGITKLSSGQEWKAQRTFTVPPPGRYTLEVRDLAGDNGFPGPASVRFDSVP